MKFFNDNDFNRFININNIGTPSQPKVLIEYPEHLMFGYINVNWRPPSNNTSNQFLKVSIREISETEKLRIETKDAWLIYIVVLLACFLLIICYHFGNTLICLYLGKRPESSEKYKVGAWEI